MLPRIAPEGLVVLPISNAASSARQSIRPFLASTSALWVNPVSVLCTDSTSASAPSPQRVRRQARIEPEVAAPGLIDGDRHSRAHAQRRRGARAASSLLRRWGSPGRAQRRPAPAPPPPPPADSPAQGPSPDPPRGRSTPARRRPGSSPPAATCGGFARPRPDHRAGTAPRVARGFHGMSRSPRTWPDRRPRGSAASRSAASR